MFSENPADVGSDSQYRSYGLFKDPSAWWTLSNSHPFTLYATNCAASNPHLDLTLCQRTFDFSSKFWYCTDCLGHPTCSWYWNPLTDSFTSSYIFHCIILCCRSAPFILSNSQASKCFHYVTNTSVLLHAWHPYTTTTTTTNWVYFFFHCQSWKNLEVL